MKRLFTVFLVLFSVSAFSQANMPTDREFISSRKYFKLRYPSDWNMYENPDGTYHFEKQVYGSGTMEIKESRNFSDSTEILHFLENESFSHPMAKFQYNDNKTILHYNSMMLIEGRETMVFVWLVANKNTVLICRYAVDNKLKGEQKAQAELQAVTNMMQTVSFLP